MEPKASPAETAAPPGRAVWNRYGFLLGVAANLAVAASCARFFLLPSGSGLDYEDWAFLFVMPVSILAFAVGGVLCLRDMGRRRAGGGSVTLEAVGLALNCLPYPLAMFLLSEAMSLRRLWDDG